MELSFSKNQFILNGYPVGEVDRAFSSYMCMGWGGERAGGRRKEAHNTYSIFPPFVPVFL